MSSISVIGLDIAKNVFQVHGVDDSGEVVDRRQLRHGQMLGYFAKLSPCLIGIEACSTAHYWGRELRALGHEVRLIPPQYVKPYVKRNKTDAADAEAICEAVTRPSMRLADVIQDETDARIPDLARQVLKVMVEQLQGILKRIEILKQHMMAWHKENQISQLLETIPGIGPVTATAIAATVADVSVFSSGRQFSAWLGLVPGQHSTGGRQKLGPISKRGDGYLRRLLVTGATAALERSKTIRAQPWVKGMLKRHPKKLVAVALGH